MTTPSPAATDFTGSGVTEGQFKTAMTNLLSYLNGLLGTDGTAASALATLGVPNPLGLFVKLDPTTVCFNKTGSGAATIKAGTYMVVGSTLLSYLVDTAITMPTLVAGTDYAIWVKDDKTIQATSSFTSAPGSGNWRKIGGFHYAPGDNASGTSGGNTTPQINAYSFWDVNFRPKCSDARGMTLVANSFWSDIYLLNTNHITNGTSKYNATIADGSSPPLIPTAFGGNGSNSYSSLTVWEAAEVIAAYGKRLPNLNEFPALAYGTTEGASIGADQGSTVWNAAYVSKWGCNQVAGVMNQWGANWGGAYSTAGWSSNTNGRGQTYNAPNAVLFGGNWGNGASAGSRCSGWNDAPSNSNNVIGARGVCDHLSLVY